MSSGRSEKLYFLKLPDKFLYSDVIRWIEKQSKGAEVIIFFLRLISIAKNRDGKLIRIIGEKEIPFTVEDIAMETYQEESFIKYALNILEEAGLVEKEDNIYFIPKSLEFTNQTTVGAEYMKDYRARKKEDNKFNIECNYECNTDIEKEKEEEKRNKKLDKEDKVIAKEKEAFVEVIQYLNYILKTSYKVDNQEICALITERVSEGYTVENMKNVILSRYDDWKGTKYATGLRYQTLLGEKFGVYLEMYNDAHKYDHLYANLS